MKTIVVGIGNTILGDDGVGICVSRYLKKELGLYDGVEVRETEEAGINLLELLEGFQKAVIVDSITTGGQKAGHIYRLKPRDLVGTSSNGTYSSHQLGIAALCDLAERLQLDMPKDVVIYAVEIAGPQGFSGSLTCEIESIVPRVAGMIKQELQV